MPSKKKGKKGKSKKKNSSVDSTQFDEGAGDDGLGTSHSSSNNLDVLKGPASHKKRRRPSDNVNGGVVAADGDGSDLSGVGVGGIVGGSRLNSFIDDLTQVSSNFGPGHCPGSAAAEASIRAAEHMVTLDPRSDPDPCCNKGCNQALGQSRLLRKRLRRMCEGESTFKMTRFSSLVQTIPTGKRVASDVFTVGPHRWRMIVYPNGLDEEHEDFVRVALWIQSMRNGDKVRTHARTCP